MHTRASAYALAIHEGHVLLTQLAHFCTRAGHWTLPGGGIDHGEQPVETLLREVHEETGLTAADPQILYAHTYSETSSRGDFLAVQIVYTATVRGTPVVQELGGSTADARWIPLDQVAELPTVGLVTAALQAYGAASMQQRNPVL